MFRHSWKQQITNDNLQKNEHVPGEITKPDVSLSHNNNGSLESWITNLGKNAPESQSTITSDVQGDLLTESSKPDNRTGCRNVSHCQQQSY